MPGGYDPSQYVSERLWATARDGTKVPLSISSCGFPRDGSPLLLYGYGAHGIGMFTTLSSSRLVLLDADWPSSSPIFEAATIWANSGADDGKLMKSKTPSTISSIPPNIFPAKWTSRKTVF